MRVCMRKQWCETNWHTQWFPSADILGPTRVFPQWFSRAFTERETSMYFNFYPLISQKEQIPFHLSPLYCPSPNLSFSLYLSSFLWLIFFFSLVEHIFWDLISCHIRRSNDSSKHGGHYCFFREVSSELFAKPTNKRWLRFRFSQKTRSFIKLWWDTR